MISPFTVLDPRTNKSNEEKSVLNKIIHAEKNLKLVVQRSAKAQSNIARQESLHRIDEKYNFAIGMSNFDN